MTDEDRTQQMKDLLTSTLIRDRAAGIRLAAELLAQDGLPDDVRALLEKIASGDPITMVREHAGVTLDIDQARRVAPTQSPPPDSALFRARCPAGHAHLYDKREVCSSAHSGRGPLAEIRLACKEPGCQQVFTVEVDCGEYR